jgi:hypothetical protein
MFRPLRAIFRWIIYTGYFIRGYLSVTDLLFVFLVIDYIYFFSFMLLRFFALVSRYVVDM